MERINLKANIRNEVGKEAAKKLRQQGLIPAVIYKGKDTLSIKISAPDFLEAIHTKAGENVIVNLQIEEDAKDKSKPHSSGSQRDKGAAKSKRLSKTAIIKEVQYHPVRGDVLHVDFNGISLTEMLTVKVPIAAKGEAVGIKEGGVLAHALWEVEIECLPTQIPESIPVDVSALKIGDSLLVKDLPLPEGVKIIGDPEATVISLAVPHVEEEAEEKPEEELQEPEVIMEKKPTEEEEAAADESKGKEQEKDKKPKS